MRQQKVKGVLPTKPPVIPVETEEEKRKKKKAIEESGKLVGELIKKYTPPKKK